MTPEEYAHALYPILEVVEGSQASKMMVQQFRAAIRAAYEDAAKIAMEYDTEKHANTAVSFNTASAIAAAIRSRSQGE
jgi:uncharacterized iron-regulated membrane protein